MIDSVVILVFSLFILIVGISFSRTGTNLKSFFAGGESVPWFVAGLSLFMSFFSAGTFVAWGSIAYQYGWVAITIQWTMGLGAIVAGVFLAPKWKNTKSLTAAEFIKWRLGPSVQKIFIYIFTFVSLFIKGSVLYSVAILVSTILGYPLWMITIVLGILMISYTAIGGLWAVMVSDILQFVVLTAAVLIILPLVFSEIGGINGLIEKVPHNFFHLTNGEYSWGFIAAYAIYHIFYIGGNWTFVQRYTSVNSPKNASKVAYLFAALYFVSPIIWMIPPMAYQAINPNLIASESENAYILVCQQVLPAGLLGLMLTGMYFSTSASANTALNVISAVFTNDIYKSSINPNADDKKLMIIARASSWFFGFFMILIALGIPYVGGIVEFTISLGAITGGPLLLPPIWALISKRLSGRASIYISLICLLTNIFFKSIAPFLLNLKLSRSEEMLLGVLFPVFLLLAYEIWMRYRNLISQDYIIYQVHKLTIKAESSLEIDREEEANIRKQNIFGLKVISFSLFFIALLLYILSIITTKATLWVSIVATLVFVVAWIPLFILKKSSQDSI